MTLRGFCAVGPGGLRPTPSAVSLRLTSCNAAAEGEDAVIAASSRAWPCNALWALLQGGVHAQNGTLCRQRMFTDLVFARSMRRQQNTHSLHTPNHPMLSCLRTSGTMQPTKGVPLANSCLRRCCQLQQGQPRHLPLIQAGAGMPPNTRRAQAQARPPAAGPPACPGTPSAEPAQAPARRTQQVRVARELQHLGITASRHGLTSRLWWV